MAAAGIDPKTIDTIIISHYHGDHVNGLLKADNSLAFRMPKCWCRAPEHKYWADAGEERPLPDTAHRRHFQERPPRHRQRGGYEAPAHV